MSNLERPRAEDPYSKLPAIASFTLNSDDFEDGGRLDDAFASDKVGGGDQSPALQWTGFPASTKGFVVTCFDPDAPTPSGFWHWSLVEVPASVHGLSRGAGSGNEAPEGAFHVRNDAGTERYTGCAPPAGDREHRYMFVVHALDVESLGLDSGASPAAVAFTALPHTLARAIRTGTYST